MAADVAKPIDDAAQAGRGGGVITDVAALIAEGNEDEDGADLEGGEQAVGAGKADAIDEEAGGDDGEWGEGPGSGGVEGEAADGGALADDVGHHGLSGGAINGPEGGGPEDKEEEGDEGGPVRRWWWRGGRGCRVVHGDGEGVE